MTSGGMDDDPLLHDETLWWLLMTSDQTTCVTVLNVLLYCVAIVGSQCLNDLLTINNPKFEDIYPPQLEVKKETDSRLSYLDHELNMVDGRFTTAVFDKRDGFNFHIVNFPYMDSNIPSKPAYGIYISQLVRIGRVCDNIQELFQ